MELRGIEPLSVVPSNLGTPHRDYTPLASRRYVGTVTPQGEKSFSPLNPFAVQGFLKNGAEGNRTPVQKRPELDLYKLKRYFLK